MKYFIPGLFIFLVGVMVGCNLPSTHHAKIEYYACKYTREKNINMYKQAMIDALWNRYRGERDNRPDLANQGYKDYTEVADAAEIYKANSDCEK